MKQTMYITEPPEKTVKIFHKTTPIIAGVLALMVAFLAVGFGSFLKPKQADAGPIEWIVCDWSGKDSIPYFAYKAANTDDIAYMFNSKSAVSSGQEDVTGGLNTLLGLNHDFKTINQKIMGTGLNQTDDYTGDVNQGEKVNPYDRFGISGLFWTSYSGEWNYLKVDICNDKADPVNMRIGNYYDGRLAPTTTWGGASQSTDVRSLIASQKDIVLANDWVNVVANGIFDITKFIIAVVITLVSLAFSDITNLIGLDSLIGSDNGLFNKLYNGLYLPLILIVMLMMGVWVVWNGIIKRAYRRTLSGVAQSIGMFILAAVVAFNPLFFISLPNNAVVVIQSIIINAMSSSIYAGNGICSVGGVYTVDSDGNQVKAEPDSDSKVDTAPKNNDSSDTTDTKKQQSLLEQRLKSTQSVIGCQIWYTYLFKPWVKGQFGTDFDNLWAKGYKDESNNKSAKELQNDNSDWVGNAEVPLGGGYTLHNWALFQLSTQTNSHVPLGEDSPTRSTFTDGVANDWWRIVDAVSNYNEITQSNGIPSGCTNDDANRDIQNSGNCTNYNPKDTENVNSQIPDTSKKPTEYWESWIGARPQDRVAVAIGSLFPAVFGNLAVLGFAAMSVIFAIGVALAMAFAPIFLLLGSWPGRGWNMFKAWAQLVLNLSIKRLMAGVLLVFSLIFVSMILEFTKDNWFISLIVMSVVSIAIFKLRHQILRKIAALFTFKFADYDLAGNANRSFSKFSQMSKDTAEAGAMIGGGALLGAYMGKKSGQGIKEGSKVGLKRGLRNAAYKHRMLNQAIVDSQIAGGKPPEPKKGEICAYCYKPLDVFEDGSFHGGLDQEGNYVCENCMNNPFATISGKDPYLDGGARKIDIEKSEDKKPQGQNTREKKTSSGSIIAEGLKDLPTKFKNAKTGKTSEDLSTIVGELFALEFSESIKNNTIPEIPEQLKPHMDKKVQKQIPHLWRDENPQSKETLAYVYANSIANYFYKNGLDIGEFSGDPDKGAQGDVNVIYGSMLHNMVNKNQSDDED